MSPNDEQRKPSVLSDLPSGRPQLRSERRGAAKPKPKPAPRAKAAAKPTATAPANAAATSKTKAAAKPRKREPVAPPPKADERPFVTTAIQAAAELAQIGIAVGARAVRNALDRLPKP
jgi:hypothetical protein